MEPSTALRLQPAGAFRLHNNAPAPFDDRRVRMRMRMRIQHLAFPNLQSARLSIRPATRIHPLLVCSATKQSSAAETLQNHKDEAIILKKKSEDVLSHLDDRCIYLVGLMGSGKTTVGKIIGEVLGYAVFDSDKLAEQTAGMPSVAEIFHVHGEAFFRDIESQVLKDLSTMKRLVVATGGGAVVRPVNWRYMKEGISIWLDVPLEALARRIAAVGTASRPLLDQESGDPYTKAFAKLSALIEQRYDAYANADIRLSLEDMAAKKGHEDVTTLTPKNIAIEALDEIQRLIA
ncbi:Shikimate kinase [Rhynchospora pubera]|uniref:shikimate kinase n=1 Tax=Rhynchospora pubera TaxID=906938 RepID=A0AAV8FIR2_9POAL|nr:Shikimate kinase [Rhynchospora pubera]